jgi:hypothetical protein
MKTDPIAFLILLIIGFSSVLASTFILQKFVFIPIAPIIFFDQSEREDLNPTLKSSKNIIVFSTRKGDIKKYGKASNYIFRIFQSILIIALTIGLLISGVFILDITFNFLMPEKNICLWKILIRLSK